MFLIKLLSVTALILTGQNVWTKYAPTESERINYDFDIDEVKDPDGSINDTPTLVTVVVVKNNSPRSEQYESFEDSRENFQSFQNNKDDERIEPLPINIYDFIDFDDAIGGEINLENDVDYKEILRKKKKKKKKKTCKKACVKAAKSVCKKVECSSKKKKSIAKSCLRQCSEDSDD